MIRAGQLRHRPMLQRFVTTVDPVTGDREKQWVDVKKVWASVEPISAREFIAAAASQSKVTARIVTRRNATITHDMRFVHKGKVYNIEGVLPDKESGEEYQTHPVSEGVDDG